MRYRAVEEGVPVIRVTNMSLSGVFAPSGDLTVGMKVFPDGRTEVSDLLDEKAVLDVDIPKRVSTVFSRTGNRPVVALLLFGLICTLMPAGKKRRR